MLVRLRGNDMKLKLYRTHVIYRERIEGIVVESTYNGYWLADGLEGAGNETLHQVLRQEKSIQFQ